MKRQTIAVDVDNVLAIHAPALIEYSNRLFGSSLTIDDYSEHWSQMWQVDHEETERRSREYHLSGELGGLEHYADAESVLHRLHKDYRLIILTARRVEASRITIDWINKHFDGIFDGINFAGIWDKIDENSIHMTKAEMCRELGADFLIDDQSKHCNGAAEVGLKALMFGDYPWCIGDKTVAGVTRCADWQAVEEYFYGR